MRSHVTAASRGSRAMALALVAFVVAIGGVLTPQSPEATPERSTRIAMASGDTIVISASPGRLDEVVDLVESAGGQVLDRIDEVSTILVADLDGDSLETLLSSKLITGASVNTAADLNSAGWRNGDARMLARRPGSGYHTGEITGATDYHARGIEGDGVGIALIDSGVSPVPGLDRPGQIIDAADYSLADGSPMYRDCYGHGTHLSGLIAGGDLGIEMDRDWSVGMAPGAHIVNVRVADCEGSTDLWSVMRGVIHATQTREQFNTEVMVLALSIPSSGSYRNDPLSAVIEKAWHSGITVVVAAGNAGNGNAVTSPATNPFVVAVGGSDHADSTDPRDDRLARFSSSGMADGRGVDLVAPSRAIISLRVPGSYIDEHFDAQVKNNFLRGSGTSQAAAIAAGGVALVVQERPNLDPDQIKVILGRSARPLAGVAATEQGAGALDLHDVSKIHVTKADARQRWAPTRWTWGDPVPAELVSPTGNRWAGNRWASSDWH